MIMTVVRRSILTPKYHAASTSYRADRQATPAPNDTPKANRVRFYLNAYDSRIEPSEMVLQSTITPILLPNIR